YRVRPDGEADFLELVGRHWPLLHDLGVVTDDPALVFRSVASPPTVVEIFTWLYEGFSRASEHPDVLAIWEPMEQLCEERDGRPALEFPHFEPVALAR
ncbi:MAG TPA: hypothetical protein VKH36_03510, partial [Acidimicrobiia bacterium]|nr:hypothetical protein [Acidimicrobiia bacterium]